MYQIPVGFGFPAPIDFGSVFVADVSLGFAAWLGVAAVVYLALLPLALRRSKPQQVETVLEGVGLRKAA